MVLNVLPSANDHRGFPMANLGLVIGPCFLPNGDRNSQFYDRFPNA